MRSRLAALFVALQLVVAVLGGALLTGPGIHAAARDASAVVRAAHGTSTQAGVRPSSRLAPASSRPVVPSSSPSLVATLSSAGLVVPPAEGVRLEAPRAVAQSVPAFPVSATARGPPRVG